MISKSVRRAVLDREDGCCAMCGKSLWGQWYSLQHRRARGSGGSKAPDTNQPQNLVAVCGSATSAGGCHQWIESHPVEAERVGYRVPQGGEPVLFPIRIKGRGWNLLNADGTYEQLDSYNASALRFSLRELEGDPS